MVDEELHSPCVDDDVCGLGSKEHIDDCIVIDVGEGGRLDDECDENVGHDDVVCCVGDVEIHVHRC